jgi:hypothetical protein
VAPKTWRQKFEVAERRRNREFNSRERFVEALNDFLPEVLKEREKKARAILDKHKGIMPRDGEGQKHKDQLMRM